MKLTLLRAYLPINVLLHCCNATISYDMKFICHLLKHTSVYFNIKAHNMVYLSRWLYDFETKSEIMFMLQVLTASFIFVGNC